MKTKVILSMFLIILMVFLIYLFNVRNDNYYFSIMDKEYDYKTYNNMLKENIKLEEYVDYFENQYRITDLIRDINDNKIIDDRKIQNILIKASIITLMIGNNELDAQVNILDMTELFEYSNSLLDDIDKLFNLIRKYSKEKIFFIGFYTNNEYYEEIYKYINFRVRDMCEYYNIIYIDRNDYFNKQENVNIYEKIMSNI